MLAQLDKVEGVARSYANHTGNMVRVSVAAAANLEQTAEKVEKILTKEKRNPGRLKGEDLTQALDNQQWREGERVSELSAIEYRTLGIRRIQAFAAAEKLDSQSTEKLVQMAGAEWDRLAGAKTDEDREHPGPIDWTTLCEQFDAAVMERAKSLLTTEQLEHLKQWKGAGRGK